MTTTLSLIFCIRRRREIRRIFSSLTTPSSIGKESNLHPARRSEASKVGDLMVRHPYHVKELSMSRAFCLLAAVAVVFSVATEVEAGCCNQRVRCHRVRTRCCAPKACAPKACCAAPAPCSTCAAPAPCAVASPCTACGAPVATGCTSGCSAAPAVAPATTTSPTPAATNAPAPPAEAPKPAT